MMDVEIRSSAVDAAVVLWKKSIADGLRFIGVLPTPKRVARVAALLLKDAGRDIAAACAKVRTEDKRKRGKR